jgi:hypothetical protein
MPGIGLALDRGQWLAVITVVVAFTAAVESWIGHVRSGFPRRVQYFAPLAGSALLVAAVDAALMPAWTPARWFLGGAGWLAVALGGLGTLFHYYYGIGNATGGRAWWRHHLLYAAPPLAPLTLSLAGALGVIATASLEGQSAWGAVALDRLILLIVAIALGGVVVQTGILHYRGAFNTPVMYVPLTVPPASAICCAWSAVQPSAAIDATATLLLWITFFIGFVGLGMHLRGLDRQMGGLHVFGFNVLQGPPPLAPVAYSALAAAGLLALGRW